MNRFMSPNTDLCPAESAQSTPGHDSIGTELPLAKECQNRLAKPLIANERRGFFGRQLINRFRSLAGGEVELQDRFGTIKLGQDETTDELTAKILVGRTAFYQRVFFGGTIGSAESYMDGQWATDDLTSLIRIMIRNLDRISALERTWAKVKNRWHFIQHLWRRNTINGSQKNIHDHYDLGNDFYRLFLDPTLSYSSGIFESANPADEKFDDMHQASIRKMEQICRKLQLKPSDQVLEIGTGWGALAIYMAKHFGCRVTTTTISNEQYAVAVERVRAEGLEDRITVLLQDYRLLEGSFDKIVSVEMIEAVGHQYYDEYFSRCSNLLRADGAMLLQSITISEQIFDYHIKHVDFIRKYVFPGGCLPSVTALAGSVGRVTDMRMLYQEDITPHYVKTLACWRREFMDKLDQVRELGYDEPFIRLWHFYLCYCEAAFAERRVHNTHLVFAKPKCSIDPSVDYNCTTTGLRNASPLASSDMIEPDRLSQIV